LGTIVVGELRETGVLFTSATATSTAAPVNRLIAFTPLPNDPNFAGSVQAIVREGGTDVQTVITVNNRSVPAALKICKIAGPGILELTPFTFNVTGFVALPAGPGGVVPIGSQPSGNIPVTVLAGPAPRGFCQIVGAPGAPDGIRFVVDSLATVTETGPATAVGTFGEVRVLRITSSSGIVRSTEDAERTTGAVNPQSGAASGLPNFGQLALGAAPVGGSPFLFTSTTAATANRRAPGAPLFPIQTGTTANTTATRTVTVPITREVAEVEYVNIGFAPVPLKICKVAGQGVAPGTPFTFTITTDTGSGVGSTGGLGTAFSTTATIQAGPAGTGQGSQNGFCDFVSGPFGGSFQNVANGALSAQGLTSFNAFSTVRVQETGFGTTVINAGGITSPTGGVIANTTDRSAVLTLILNQNEVAFVNSAPSAGVKSRKRTRMF
jgi:hypothetical protein